MLHILSCKLADHSFKSPWSYQPRTLTEIRSCMTWKTNLPLSHTNTESYLHVIEDEEQRISVELIEEFRRVQHRRWCQRVVWRCRTWIARKICSANNTTRLLPLFQDWFKPQYGNRCGNSPITLPPNGRPCGHHSHWADIHCLWLFKTEGGPTLVKFWGGNAAKPPTWRNWYRVGQNYGQ